MRDNLDARAPSAWEIRPSPADGSGGWLRIGQRAYALRDISEVSSECSVEPNIDGHLAMIAGFLLLGAAFILPVALKLVSQRFLIGGILFAGIGLMGASEILRRRATRLYRLHISLRDGSRTVFTTADPADALSLHSQLARGLRAAA